MTVPEGYEWVGKAAEESMATIADLATGRVTFTGVNIRTLSNIYLQTSHAYYQDDASLMPDTLFDKMCKFLLKNWKAMEEDGVWFSLGIFKENLEAGTCLLERGHAPVTIYMSKAMQKVAERELEDLLA